RGCPFRSAESSLSPLKKKVRRTRSYMLWVWSQASDGRRFSLYKKIDSVFGIQFRNMIVSRNSELKDMPAGLDARQCSAAGIAKHAHKFPVDVGMQMVASFPFDEFIAHGNLVAVKHLSFLGRKNGNFCSIGWVPLRCWSYEITQPSKDIEPFGVRL